VTQESRDCDSPQFTVRQFTADSNDVTSLEPLDAYYNVGYVNTPFCHFTISSAISDYEPRES